MKTVRLPCSDKEKKGSSSKFTIFVFQPRNQKINFYFLNILHKIVDQKLNLDFYYFRGNSI